MESCLAAAALNGVDRRSLQRSARLGQEVLERAKRRAVDWHSQERPRGSTGVLSWEGPYHAGRPPAGPLCLLPGEKYYSSVPEEGGTTHVCRYHRGKSMVHLCSETGNGQRKDRGEAAVGPGGCLPASEHTLESSQSTEDISKDLYIEVYPGTYSVTVGSSDFTKKTHVVAVDSGQSVDLVFPV
uniref:A-kinase interacting protein 1 n=1 Tax=Oryctolagus cuniculus TaxID=9986 RepID=A0A5F9DS13_RABIT